ncbi:MAG TPA: carboxypeptidase regulatory-like domain-containing protein [Pyrinomonadaceae bacterium]|jgi:hypothetical protein|nr:carboxypeptidase regulatory-like domain-containing protein [Pyrinomonadaceae bacterium]
MQTRDSESKTFEAAALALLLLALLATAVVARAQLTPPPKWKDARCTRLNNARAVFVGRVLGFERVTLKASRREEPQRLVRFAVEERFRPSADKDKEVGVYAAPPESPPARRACGRDFEMGRSYLVYVNEYTLEPRTDICRGGGVPVAEAADDLAYLRALKRGEPITEVAGRVEQLHHEYATNTLHFARALEGIEVTAELRGRALKAKTDADGRYHFTGLVPGPYNLSINVPEGFYTVSSFDAANTAASPCYQADFQLAPDGRIAGRATDPEGRPIAEAALELVPADTFPADESKINEDNWRAVLTDADGRFEFSKVPGGRYLLGMNLRGVTEDVPFNIHPTGFFPRTYYPGTTARAEARVIELGEGGSVSGLTLTLVPQPRRELVRREVEGTVVLADGHPAPCAWIGLNAAKYADRSPNSWNRVGEGGRFTVQGYEGFNYAVQVYVAVLDEQGRNTGLIHVRTAIVSPTATTAPLRIVLPPEVNCEPRRPPKD